MAAFTIRPRQYGSLAGEELDNSRHWPLTRKTNNNNHLHHDSILLHLSCWAACLPLSLLQTLPSSFKILYLHYTILLFTYDRLRLTKRHTIPFGLLTSLLCALLTLTPQLSSLPPPLHQDAPYYDLLFAAACTRMGVVSISELRRERPGDGFAALPLWAVARRVCVHYGLLQAADLVFAALIAQTSLDGPPWRATLLSHGCIVLRVGIVVVLPLAVWSRWRASRSLGRKAPRRRRELGLLD